MPGNRTSPLAALLAPLLGYGQGLVKKRDYDRQMAEEDRKAALEEQRLGLDRRQVDLQAAAGARDQQQIDSLERERARGAGEKSGALARRVLARQQLNEALQSGKRMHEVDPTLWEEAGVDAGDYKAIQPYDAKSDPSVALENLRHRHDIEEIDRRSDHDVGLAATKAKLSQAGLTPEEQRRLTIANTNFAASLRATAADMGDLSPEDQDRLWQASLRRAGLDPMKFSGMTPGGGDLNGSLGGESIPYDGPSAMVGDTAFMRALGIP